MPKSSTPASKAKKMHLKQLKSIEQCAPTILFPSKTTRSSSDRHFDELLEQGKTLTDAQFERLIKDRPANFYWQILAERTRLQLEEVLNENRQLHELVDELNKENEQLQMKTEQCEYLTNIFNSITSECDSGIELHFTDESPLTKRQKTHF